VRIPKRALPELCIHSLAEPFRPAGVVQPYARELMGLTPSERWSLEEALQRHYADVDQVREAGIYETNGISRRFVASTRFVLPEPGDEVEQRGNQTLAELRSLLGEERWPLVEARLKKNVLGSSSLNLRAFLLVKHAQSLEVGVALNDTGTPEAAWCLSGGVVGCGSGALSLFLPGGDPNQTNGLTTFGGTFLSEALRQRGATWLQEQAIARLGQKEKP